MSRSTRGDDYQDVPRPVAALADEYPPNSYDPPHSHKRGQFVYAISGVLVCTTRDATFVVPPQRGLWVPSGDRTPWLKEGGKGTKPLVVHFQVRPNPLAK